MRGRVIGLALLGATAFGPTATAQVGQAPPPAQQIDEIVVTARRIGIPVWRVTGPRTSIVLIGSIGAVAKGTRWDPGALAATLRKADRVMFPDVTGIGVSPFSMAGYYIKFRRMGTLPKGQSLAGMMSPAQFRQLTALKDRGVLKAGFERRHPLHLSIKLRDMVKDKVGEAPGVDRFVRQIVNKHKLRMVPIRSVPAKSFADDFFATPARAYVPCLMASAALAHAGPGAVRERSRAWAERRVPDVLASPAETVLDACVPPAALKIDRVDLRPQIRGLMAEPRLTVAVVGLASLAKPGGILDDLTRAGFKVTGPAWRR